MTTWNYILGNEKDFEGAPDWCKQVIRQLGTDNIGYEENCNGFQSMGDKIWWPSESSLDNCNTLSERDVNGTSNIEIIAQREPVTNDNINHPLRYTKGDIECIDAIKAATVGKTGIEAVDVGHVIRYLWRYEEKDGLESVRKAEWYIKHLIKELERNK